MVLFINNYIMLSRADVIIGNIQNLHIRGLMLQCVTSIKKFAQTRVIFRL